MQILDGPGLTFPTLKTIVTPLPPLASIGASIAPGPGTGTIESLFQEFARFTETVDGSESLSTAMHSNFMAIIAPGNILPIGKTLYQAIAEEYAELEFDALGGGLTEQNKFFKFAVFLYISTFHFSVWYTYKIGQPFAFRLHPAYVDFMRDDVANTYFKGGLRVSSSVLNSTFFVSAFGISYSLTAMHNCFNHLGDKNGFGRYSNIIKKNGTAAKLDPREYLDFRIDVVSHLREKCSSLIDDDISIFLGKILDQFPAVGERILRGYGSLDMYSVGDGGTTTGLFGQPNYGNLFMTYEPNRKATDLNHPAIPQQLGIRLIDSGDKDMVATLYYLGLETPENPASAVHVKLYGYRDTDVVDDHPGRNELYAVDPATYVFSRGGIDPVTHIFKKEHIFPAETVARSDLGDRIDVVSCDLHSSSGLDPEEMTFLIFKHHLVDPARLPRAISLSTKRLHLDNAFQTVLAAASGQTPAVVAPAIFNEPATKLSDLALALATDAGFEFDAVIEGMGIGEKLDVAGKGGRAVGKAIDQRDRPTAPGYELLRYDHAWVDWYPGAGGTSGWLLCQATGFASPLRCTWKENFPLAQQQMLETFFEDLVTRDAQGRPVYNCMLSAFRAFSLFHSLVETLSQALDALGTPGAAAAKQKIGTYLKNEAQVSVILPTGMRMAAPPLKYATIEPFYFP
ncbi:MAG: hypothetical protein JWN66_3267 [Sphingomonas bacterium]|nr:hypothetical protein [Sphingomonas bacterium]